MKRKTHEEFVKQVYDLVGDEYTVLGTYVNALTKIKMKHCICDNTWDIKPNDFLNGHMCAKCAYKKISDKSRKTHEEFVKEVIDIHGDNFEFLSFYVNNKSKVKIKHKLCDYIWDASPKYLIKEAHRGKVCCPKCNQQIKKDTNMFTKEIKNLVNDEYIVLGEYINKYTKIKMKHNISECNHEFEATPGNFLSGSRCPNCFGKLKRTTEEFKKIVYELEGNAYLVVGEYENQRTPIKMKHDECGREFMKCPEHFIHRNERCPYCGKGMSKIELAVTKYLEKHNTNFEPQHIFDDCRYNLPLRFDFL